MSTLDTAACPRCAELQAEIEDLRSQLEELNGALNSQSDRMYEIERRSSYAIHRAQDEARRIEQEVQDRRYERERVVCDLERATSYGDDWGVERATRKLRDLG